MRKIYIVSVHGEYITETGDDGKGRKLKSYEAMFRLFDLEAARSIIRGKLLMPFLKKQDPGAVYPYSYHIDDVSTEVGGGAIDIDDIPVSLQNIAQLMEYCKKNKLPVPVSDYSDLERCREHVILAKENPTAFKQVFEIYKKDMVEDQELAALNRNFMGIGKAGGAEVDIDPETGIAVKKQIGKKSHHHKKIKGAETEDLLK